MDLNTALMEITSMSECYVAANMRTSFTDLADSGSLGSNLSASQSAGTQSAGQSLSSVNEFHKSSDDFIHKPQFSSSLSQSHHRTVNPSIANHHNPIHHSHHLNLNQATSNHHLSTITNNNHQRQSSHSNSSYHTSSRHYGAQNNHNYTVTNSIPHHRLSQPTRTQIPIHCYIEQLDACADLPSYNPSVTDNELFSTTDKSLSNRTNVQQNQSNQFAQSHLHQSKLALESVTNCNGVSGDISIRGEIGTNLASDNVNDSDNNNDDIDNCNGTTTIAANSGGLFHDNEINNNVGEDDLEANLDQLNPDSPSSIHHQLPPHQESNNISAPFNHQAISPSYEGHHFQSCRETYAIVTSNVLYIDLLRTVLLQLGYSATDLINAKATIQIKNWKPLGLDQVTDDKEATVGEVLGDILTFVTLRIRLYRRQETGDAIATYLLTISRKTYAPLTPA